MFILNLHNNHRREKRSSSYHRWESWDSKFSWLGQSHTATKCWSWDTNKSCAPLKSGLFTTISVVPKSPGNLLKFPMSRWLCRPMKAQTLEVEHELWVVFETPKLIPMCRKAWELLNDTPSLPTPASYFFYHMQPLADEIWPWGLCHQCNHTVVIFIVLCTEWMPISRTHSAESSKQKPKQATAKGQWQYFPIDNNQLSPRLKWKTLHLRRPFTLLSA